MQEPDDGNEFGKMEKYNKVETYQATCPTKPLCTKTARPVWQAQGWLISPHMSFGKSPMSSPSLPLTSVSH